LATAGGAGAWGLAARAPVAAVKARVPETDATFAHLEEPTTLCAGVRALAAAPKARVLVASATECRVALDLGALRLHVEPSQGTHAQIVTPHATVDVLGTVLAVEVALDATEVTVERGRVAVRGRAGDARLDADETARFAGGAVARARASDAQLGRLRELAARLALDPPVEPEVPHDAATEPPDPAPGDPSAGPAPSADRRVAQLRGLLAREAPAAVRGRVLSELDDPRLARRRAELETILAETYQAEGAYAQALEAYSRAWRGPRSATASHALLAGADLSLRRLGQPTRARGLYERYLAEYPDGALRELASAGRCRAIAAAGGAVAACVEEHAREFPRGRLRAQLEELARTPEERP
ncbi:MAG: FecR domain-containing protein, partial [Sandaracinaceae bacterium]|nr:FecR domain-containing protein [Sandaracinaceae bacterium]